MPLSICDTCMEHFSNNASFCETCRAKHETIEALKKENEKLKKENEELKTTVEFWYRQLTIAIEFNERSVRN